MKNQWIEYNKPWKDYEGECFLHSGLCQAGTIIEADNGNTYLIGDINEEGGTCKCCNAFTMDTIIKRYKILNREEETDTENHTA
jgi:hypothetical protein